MKAAPLRSGLSHSPDKSPKTSSSSSWVSPKGFFKTNSMKYQFFHPAINPFLPPCRFQYFLNEKENPEFFVSSPDIKVHLVPLFSSHKSPLQRWKTPLLFSIFSPDFSRSAGREAGEKAIPSFKSNWRHCHLSQSLIIAINKIRPIDIKYSLSLWEYATIGWLRAGLPNRVGHRWATIAVGETHFRMRPFP